MNEYKGTDYVVMSLESYEALVREVREKESLFRIEKKSYNSQVELVVDRDASYEIAKRLFNESRYTETHTLKEYEKLYNLSETIAEQKPSDESEDASDEESAE